MAWNRSSGYCATQSQEEAETVSVQVKVPIGYNKVPIGYNKVPIGQNKVTICDKRKPLAVVKQSPHWAKQSHRL